MTGTMSMYIAGLILLIVLLLEDVSVTAAWPTCPPEWFYDINSDACHPCHLCNKPDIAAKTVGCKVCVTSKKTTVSPEVPTCDDDMFFNVPMGECFHCKVCEDITHTKIIMGCDQCSASSTKAQDPVDANLLVKESERSALSTPALVGIVVASLIAIAVFVSTAFYVIRKKRTNVHRYQGLLGSSSTVTATTEVVSNPSNLTEVTTRITSNPNMQTRHGNIDHVMHIPVTDSRQPGAPPDKFDKNQCAHL